MTPYLSFLKQHSQFQVEIKNHYPVDYHQERIDHSLDIFIFSPFVLDTNGRTYPREQIIADSRIYTRYSIYETTLEEIIDEGNNESPLLRIERLLSKRPMDEVHRARVSYELRVLANTFLLLTEKLGEDISQAIHDPKESIKSKVNRLMKSMETFIGRFRNLESMIGGPMADKEETLHIQEGYSLADESISLTLERTLIPLYKLFADEEVNAGKKSIKKMLKAEQRYRREKGYALIEGDSLSQEEKERSIYREGILKKWAQSVNYMEEKKSSINDNTGQILAALAAAIAMAFAVIATLYANRFFVSYSLPWIAIAVLSYSLKDRIKEGLRSVFSRLLPRLVSDKSDNLFDTLANRPVGRARLKVEYVPLADLPGLIRAWYERRDSVFRSFLPEESIIHYQRRIVIKRRRLMRYHTRLSSLTEVFRINLMRYCQNMDDSEKTLWFFDNNEPGKTRGYRIYKLKIGIRINRQNDEDLYRFYTVHMKQDGIVRIKEDKKNVF